MIQPPGANSADYMNNTRTISEYLSINGIQYEEKFQMSRISYLKIGGIVPYLVTPDSLDKYIGLIRFLQESGISFKVMGNLSNCMFTDAYIDRVIVLTKKINGYQFKENEISAQAGLMLPAFVNILVNRQIAGFEGLYGIPGTIGGAIYTNAGACGNEISDHLMGIACLNKDGNIVEVTREQACYGFRSSIFQSSNEYTIVSARFKLINGDKNEINAKLHKCNYHRRTYQENEFPYLGSLFKTMNIYKEIAKTNTLYGILLWPIMKIGKLLGKYQAVVLVPLTVRYFNIKYEGKKPYSDKALNFLVNRGDLTFDKAIKYIDNIKKLIKNSVDLEIEIIDK